MPAYTLTGSAADIPVQRILVRLGVSQDMASLLLDDFRDAMDHFSQASGLGRHVEGGIDRVQPPIARDLLFFTWPARGQFLVGEDGRMTGMPVDYRLYRDLAGWWPLISPPEEYAEEAAYPAAVFSSTGFPFARYWIWAAAAAITPCT